MLNLLHKPLKTNRYYIDYLLINTKTVFAAHVPSKQPGQRFNVIILFNMVHFLLQTMFDQHSSLSSNMEGLSWPDLPPQAITMVFGYLPYGSRHATTLVWP